MYPDCNIPEARLKELRESRQGLRIAVYLDLTEDEVCDWHEGHQDHVLALSQEASRALVRLLLSLPDADALGLNDVAGINVGRFLDMGIDRQVSLATVIEGLHEGFWNAADYGDPDPFAGLADKLELDARWMGRQLRRLERARAYGAEHDEAEDAVQAAETLLGLRSPRCRCEGSE
jgi:hypothetical protein